MSIAECNKLLGVTWSDEQYDNGRGVHRIYEVLTPGGMIGADLYFRDGRLTKWWGDVEEVACLVAVAKKRPQ